MQFGQNIHHFQVSLQLSRFFIWWF